MDFTKTKCDGCGKPFEVGDDIVVCPVCGTPQHRSCYELSGGCVNARKHALGFEFDPPKPEPEAPQPQPEAKTDEPALDPVNQSLAMGELPNVNDVVEQRVEALCPGITEEQRREHVCGAELGLATSFVGNGAARYINKFRRIEQANARTFNWAAFLFCPYWFFWRKLYKPGIILAAVQVCATLLMNYFVLPILPLYQSILGGSAQSLTDAEYELFFAAGYKLMALYAVMFVIHIIVGFTADRMYHSYCSRSLSAFRQKRDEGDNESSLRFYLSKSSTSMLATALSLIVTYFLPSLLANWLFN